MSILMPTTRSRRGSCAARRAAALSALLLLLLSAPVVVAANANANASADAARPPPSSDQDEAADDARLFARMASLVLARGYPLEMAPVRTTDGHRSLVFRIPHGKAEERARKDAIAASAVGGRRPSLYGSLSSAVARRLRAWLRGDAIFRRRPTKPVAFLQHGLLGSSADFALNAPAESLAFALADAGYDVFLGNSRGNEYGRGGPAGGGASSDYFWAFSFDEMAEFDLPAQVGHALAAAGAETLYLVAFSQGTTVALASLASSGSDGGGLGRGLSPDAVELLVLMGPVAYAAHAGSAPLRRLADLGTDRLLLLLGAREFSPSSDLIRRLGGDLCLASPPLCVSALTAICGYSPDKGDPRRIPFYLNYTPSCTSVQNVAHWAQAVRGGRRGGGGGGGDDDADDDGLGGRGDAGGDGGSGGGCCGGGSGANGHRGGAAAAAAERGCFCAYDYGAECATPVVRLPQPCNQRVYGGGPRPPEYDLRRLLQGRGCPPTVLVTGGRDRLADPRDAAALAAALADAGLLRRVLHQPTFEHLDFLWGVKELRPLYARVIAELQGHRREKEALLTAAAGAGWMAAWRRR